MVPVHQEEDACVAKCRHGCFVPMETQHVLLLELPVSPNVVWGSWAEHERSGLAARITAPRQAKLGSSLLQVSASWWQWLQQPQSNRNLVLRADGDCRSMQLG